MTPTPWKRVLLVGAPTRIHPWIERAVAGSTIERLNVHALARPAQALVWKSHMEYLRANPRSADYMARLVGEWLESDDRADVVDVLGDADCCAAFRGAPFVSGQITESAEADIPATLARRRGSYDAVVLLYRDAIGLRWTAIDRVALASGAEVLVCNGRRRTFRLDRQLWKRLRRRRFLHLTWTAELLLGPAALLTGAVLACKDAIAGPPESD